MYCSGVLILRIQSVTSDRSTSEVVILVVVGSRLGEKGALFAAVDDGSATECRQGPGARGACDSHLGIGMGRFCPLIGQLGLGEHHHPLLSRLPSFMNTDSNARAVMALSQSAFNGSKHCRLSQSRIDAYVSLLLECSLKRKTLVRFVVLNSTPNITFWG